MRDIANHRSDMKPSLESRCLVGDAVNHFGPCGFPPERFRFVPILSAYKFFDIPAGTPFLAKMFLQLIDAPCRIGRQLLLKLFPFTEEITARQKLDLPDDILL